MQKMNLSWLDCKSIRYACCNTCDSNTDSVIVLMRKRSLWEGFLMTAGRSKRRLAYTARNVFCSFKYFFYLTLNHTPFALILWLHLDLKTVTADKVHFALLTNIRRHFQFCFLQSCRYTCSQCHSSTVRSRATTVTWLMNELSNIRLIAKYFDNHWVGFNHFLRKRCPNSLISASQMWILFS